jgi:hypothetical protein
MTKEQAIAAVENGAGYFCRQTAFELKGTD